LTNLRAFGTLGLEVLLAGEVFPQAKPFVKWAGGKAQLVQELCKRLPKEILQTKRIDVYVEPFVGGGAFFFYLKGGFKIGRAFLFDVNKDLVVAFKVVQNYGRELVEQLGLLEENYLSLPEEKRKDFYYEVRDKYNKQRDSFDYSQYGRSWVLRAAYMIFLNKTCYNGLYRLNRQGRFNVPHGKNKKPKICDEKNIFEASMALKDTEIICADFEESKNYVTSGALVYLDPPYRPISKTASFTGYTEDGFSDEDQKRLARFFMEMHEKGAYLLLSNSDPRNHNPDDDFLERLYEGFVIERVPASRFINCVATKRGDIAEIVVRNYGIRDDRGKC
jgi:DNA adenine methylase